MEKKVLSNACGFQKTALEADFKMGENIFGGKSENFRSGKKPPWVVFGHPHKMFPSSSPYLQFHKLMVLKLVLRESSHQSLGRPVILCISFEYLICWASSIQASGMSYKSDSTDRIYSNLGCSPNSQQVLV
ncbi:hypothetical protein TNCV_3840421 [Trichonephila clavipes]|nr:hypothetical protein TNCV_3840421 [Trichonephila clavipes]